MSRLPPSSDSSAPLLAEAAPEEPEVDTSDIFTPAEVFPEDVQNACGTAEPGPICTWVYDQTGNDLLTGIVGQVMPGLTRLVLIIVVAWFANRLARRAIKRLVRNMNEQSVSRISTLRNRAPLKDTAPISMTRTTMRTETIGGVLTSIATVAIWTIAVVMALGVFRINLGPLIAGAGILGVALGFGAQNLVRDFISGIFMLLEDQYGVGDIIDSGDAIGEVESVSLRSTRIRDVSGTLWHIPNGEIRRVGNLSQRWARALLDIGVAYRTDVDQASAVLLDVATMMSQDPAWKPFFVEPPEIWGVQDLSADAVVIRMVVKVEPAKQWAIERQLRARIKRAFDDEGIEIPFPQRTVWMHSDDGPDGASELTHPDESRADRRRRHGQA